MVTSFTAHQRKFLRFAHLIFAALWGGSAVSMVLIVCFFQPTTAAELKIYSEILFYVELFVVGPSAGGCLLTGFLYARYTPWGFFKHRWIIGKWVINIGYIAFGVFWFYPSLEFASLYAQSLPADFPLDPGSLQINTYHFTQNFSTILLFTLAVALSVFKPWGKKSRKAVS